MPITPEQARAELARRELERRGAQPEPSGVMPYIQKGLSAANAIANRPEYTTSPQGNLNQLFGMAQKGAGWAGERTAEELGGRGVHPWASAAAGTAVAMTPDILLSALTPTGTPSEPSDMSIGLMKRALGFPKGLLKTAFGRGKAAAAAKEALQREIFPGTGNANTAFSRASDLATREGERLGEMRASTGPQPIHPVFDQLWRLRSKLTQGGARGGAWDVVHGKIDEAVDTLKGLFGTKANSPQIVEPAAEAAVAGQATNPAPSSPEIGFRAESPQMPFQQRMPTAPPEAGMPSKPSYLPVSPEELARGKPEYNIPPYNRPPNFTRKWGPVFDADIVADKAAEKIRNVINRLDLNSVEAAKKRLGGGLNWFADANSQGDAKGISDAIERGVESILRANGLDMAAYRAAKSSYGNAKTMMQALNNEIAGQESRMVPSATGVVVGAGHLAHGDIPGALRDMGLWELMRRRGAGIGATSAYRAGTMVPRAVTALRSLRRPGNSD